MAVHRWDAIQVEQMNPHLTRQVIHAENITIARLELKAGGRVQEHSHHNEQVAMILSGRLKFVIDGKEVVASAGESVQLPPNIPHSVEVLADSIVVDLFSPRREDWIRGDDAYLRK